MKKVMFLLLAAAFAPAIWAQQPTGNGQQTTAFPTQAAPVKALSPEDAEIQHLQEEHAQLLKEKQIEDLRKQNEALKAQVAEKPKAKAATAAPQDPKKLSFIELMKLKARCAAEAQARRGDVKILTTVDPNGGNGVGSVAEDTTKSMDGADESKADPCALLKDQQKKAKPQNQ